MPSVDNRVVNMQFNNRQFQKAVASTTTTLQKLQQQMGFHGAQKGFQNISAAANNVQLANLGASVDSISGKFTALGAVGFTAIQSLTNSVIAAGKAMAKALIDPIVVGGKERALNIEQAKFQFRGLGIDVELAMKSALDAVRGTAYGLGDAAKIAAQLGASGIKAGDEMTGILRGIAGAAAMTGTSFGEIGDIFAQTAAMGKVTNQDLNQFATRGLNAAAAIGKQLNKTETEIRIMATNSELDFKTFSDAMEGAFGEHATKANETYSGSLANMRAALSRLGEAFYAPALTTARDLFNSFTPVIDNLTKAFKPLIFVFNLILRDIADKFIDFFKNVDLTGFTSLMTVAAKTLGDVWKILTSITAIISREFKNVFPGSFTESLAKVINGFHDLVAALRPSPAGLHKITNLFSGFFQVISAGWNSLKGIARVIRGAFESMFPEKASIQASSIVAVFDRLVDIFSVSMGTFNQFMHIFRGIFAVLAIGWEVVKNIAAVFKELFLTIDISESSNSVLSFFADLGDRLVNLKFALVDNGGIKNFFDKFVTPLIKFAASGIGPAITFIADSLKKLVSVLSDFFSGTGDINVVTGNLSERFGWLGTVLNGLQAVIGFLIDKFQDFMGWLKGVGSAIIDVFKNVDWNIVLDAINTGLFAGLVLMLKNFFNAGAAEAIGGSGFFASFRRIGLQVTNTLDLMQAKLKSDILLKIAMAIGILALALLVLSSIDPVKLTQALIAMSVGFGQLVATMVALEKFTDAKGIHKLIMISIAIGILAGAMVIFALAVKLFSMMDVDELAKGLGAVGILITGLTVAMNHMPDSGRLISAGIGMAAMAIGIVILSFAVSKLGEMDLGTLIQGLIGVGIAITGLTIAMNKMPKAKGPGILLAGLGLIAISIALNILARAISEIGSMPLNVLVQGLIGMGVALLIIGLAMNLMPATMPLIGAGLVAVGAGLLIVSKAISIIGNMELGQLVQGLIGIAAVLAVLAVATAAFSYPPAILGAIAITVVSGALLILALALAAFGGLSWGELVKGLAALAGVIIIFAIAANALAPAIPAMLALGAALILVGAGMALTGVGLLFIAKALLLVADTGYRAVEIIGGIVGVIIDQIIMKIPELVVAVAEGLIEIVEMIVEAAPGIIGKIGEAINAFFVELIRNLPIIFATISMFIDGVLVLLLDKVPKFIYVGFELLKALLNGIKNNISEITNTVIDIILAFIGVLTERAGEIVTAGMNLLAAFLQGISDNIQMVIDAGGNILINFLLGMGQKIVEVANTVTMLLIVFIFTIANNIQMIIDAGKDTVLAFLEGLAEDTVEFVDTCFVILTNFLNGLAEVIRKRDRELIDAGMNLLDAIFDGIIEGIKTLGGPVLDAIKEFAKDMLDNMLGVFKIWSPSRAMIDMVGYIADGIVIGFRNDSSAVRSAGEYSEEILDTMQNSLSKVASSLENMDEFNPTITPVLDLTNVKQGAGQLGGILGSQNLNAGFSFDKASSIVDSTRQNGSSSVTETEPVVQEVQFNQTINAPKELSTAEIYRQTKSQLAIAKEELKIS